MNINWGRYFQTLESHNESVRLEAAALSSLAISSISITV